MKTIIALKGLVKKDKLKWVNDQGLDLFFLDFEAIRRLYSTPELLTRGEGTLNFAFSDMVYRRFIEILCNRLSKGCLVVVDIEDLTASTLEVLAHIFGYTIFWVFKLVPSDYVQNPEKYTLPYYPIKSEQELIKEVQNYNNTRSNISVKGNDQFCINSYKEVIKYWNKVLRKSNTKVLPKECVITHISDIHSNFDLFENIDTKDSGFIISYGDYIDGPVSGGSRKMLDYLLKDTRENFIWLEGNHELRLRKYLGALYLKSIGKTTIADILMSGIASDFFIRTAPEFEDLTGIDAWNYLYSMNRKLKLFFVLKVDNRIYYCTHAGLKYLEQITPEFVGNVIYGSRNMDKVDRTFSEQIGKKCGFWSIHAHCKYPAAWNVHKYPHVMNIDPQDELSVVVLTQRNKKWKICVQQKQKEE